MTKLQMPPARDFGWSLKPLSSSYFDIHKKGNGQFCVVLNHALLRGVSAEMVHWWFVHFTKLKVRLENVPGYDGVQVPAYLLWHPVDHHSATLSGPKGPGQTAKPGSFIHIREAMQYDRYGWTYPADAKLKIFYVGKDGWAMGKVLPLFGPVMMLRIHFKDVYEGVHHIGAHYHYEVVIGVSGRNPFARAINNRITRHYGTEFFDAWQRHNVIEVGAFENFLPALYQQRDRLDDLTFSPEMTPELASSEAQEGFDQSLFARRLAAYEASNMPHRVQGYRKPSIL